MANRIIRGPSLTVGEAEFNVPNLMDEIQIFMDEDPEDPIELSRIMIERYAGMEGSHEDSTTPRGAYNLALIDMCGFGMRSILLAAMADKDLLEALGFALLNAEEPDDDV